MKLPRFFDVDGTLVRFDRKPGTTDEFASTTAAGGAPFPFVKALEEGKEITEDEYNRLADMNNKSSFPKFYDVDGTLVKVDSDGKTVFGTTDSGAPFPPLKAEGEGSKISKEEYDKEQSQKMPIKVIQGKPSLKELADLITKGMAHNLNTHAGEDTLERDKQKGKQLISLISTEGKSKEQMKNEAKSAYSKFIKTQGKSKEQVKNHGKTT